MTTSTHLISRRAMITQTGMAAAAVGMAGQVHAETAAQAGGAAWADSSSA